MVAGLSGSIALVVLLAFVLLTWQLRRVVKAQSDRTLAQADSILQADIRQVPVIVKSLQPFWPEVVKRLEQYKNKKDLTEVERLRLSLALVSHDKAYIEPLQKKLLTCKPVELIVIRDALFPYRDDLESDLWSIVIDSDAKRDHRLRAACALATFDPSSSQWTDSSDFLARELVLENPLVLLMWLDALRPVRTELLEPLSAVFRDKQRTESERSLAISVLLDFAVDKPDILVGLLAHTDQKHFSIIFPALAAHRSAAVPLLEAEIDKRIADTATEDQKEVLAERQANAAIALLQLGHADKAWLLLKHSPDPRARSYFIHWISPLGGDPQTLIGRLDTEPDVSIRRALLLALGEFSEQQLPAQHRQPVIKKLLTVYEQEPDPGLHGAAEWLLRQWGTAKQLEAIDTRLQANEDKLQQGDNKRQWYVTTEGHTMVILNADTFPMGSPDSEPDRDSDETLHRRSIGRKFAISSKEVTQAQFGRFEQGNPGIEEFNIEKWSKTHDSPQVVVDWYDAAAYCNWLSQQEGIPQAQWCYLPNTDGKYAAGMKPAADYLTRTGYRLPSEAEWEFACRAGSVTSRYYGLTTTLLSKYAWYQANSKKQSWPVGRLKPNDFGLFDMQGNAFEWCHGQHLSYAVNATDQAVADAPETKAVQDNQTRVLCGGSFLYPSSLVRSANRSANPPDYRASINGFRPATPSGLLISHVGLVRRLLRKADISRKLRRAGQRAWRG